MIKIKKMKMKINSGGDFAFRLNEKIMVINRQLNDSIILTVIKQIIIDR